MAKGFVRFSAAAAGAVLAVSMSACAGTPSTAATVGDKTITTAEVEKSSKAYHRISQRELGESIVLNVRVRGEGAKQVAAKAGAPMNDQMVLEALRNEPNLDQRLVEDPEFRPVMLDLARAQILEQGLGEAQFNQALKSVPLKVNPRFGLNGYDAVTFDPNSGEPMLKSPSLSKLGSPVGVENFQ